ncbi:hypothetical protein ACFQMA_12690 [Halosimplex aquaticum]|uniref:Uncharacterized protein n=1 Tax=Halosimplex aquaticum TaxID=3026162 RepID=A0ABD5Y5A1_9EURY|nr:hypothetical protein [Halosimplex aquaticum]
MRPKDRALAYATGQLVAVAVLGSLLIDLLGYAPGDVFAVPRPTTPAVTLAIGVAWAAPVVVLLLYVALPVGVGLSLVRDGQSVRRVGPWVVGATFAGPLVLAATGWVATFSPSTVPGPPIATATAMAIVLGGWALAASDRDPLPDGIPPILFANTVLLVTFAVAVVFVPRLAGERLDALVVWS